MLSICSNRPSSPALFDIGLHHGFRQVGKKSKADARGTQRLKGRLNVRIDLHFQKAVHELVMFCFAQIARNGIFRYLSTFWN